MKNKLTKFALLATIGLSLTFSFSCSSGSDDTSSNSGTFTDNRDNTTYKWVKIGEQTWMAENLNYAVEGVKCYNNEPANCTIYGKLYDWATAMALPADCNSNFCNSQVGAKHQGICQSGWHIPSDVEWSMLIDFAGGSSVAGTKLKAKSGWNNKGDKSGNGTNDYGFSALPGGFVNSVGSFTNVGNDGYWWSSSEYDSYFAYSRGMHYNVENVTTNGGKSYLRSVRCVKD